MFCVFKRLKPSFLGGLLIFAGAVAVPGQTTVITGVTVIDVNTGARQSDVSVLVDGQRIVAVGREVTIPADAERVNGEGKFLIPGLWDMHAHYQFAGAETADLLVANGVVGTRDMGADADFIFPLRERIRSGEVLGPDIVLSGPIVDDAPPNFPFRLHVTNAEEARRAVRELKELGVDFIKVHDHTPREVFFAVAEEASKVGLTFAGHVPIAVTVEEAADAGIRSIEHLANYRVFDECTKGDEYVTADCRALFSKLTADGVWQTPTMGFFEAIPDLFSGVPMEHAEFASDTLLAETQRNITNSNLDSSTLGLLRLAGRMSLDVIRDLHAEGSRFLAGCDAMVPGFCLHDELQWFVNAGFSPLEALQTATINPARFLERESLQGTVEAGKRADLVLLDADPLVDIGNTRRIAAVILRGRLVQKDEIEQVIGRHLRP